MLCCTHPERAINTLTVLAISSTGFIKTVGLDYRHWPVSAIDLSSESNHWFSFIGLGGKNNWTTFPLTHASDTKEGLLLKHRWMHLNYWELYYYLSNELCEGTIRFQLLPTVNQFGLEQSDFNCYLRLMCLVCCLYFLNTLFNYIYFALFTGVWETQ